MTRKSTKVIAAAKAHIAANPNATTVELLTVVADSLRSHERDVRRARAERKRHTEMDAR